MRKLNNYMYLTVIAILLIILAFGSAALLNAQEKEPERGIKIILNVYSGRQNPHWWLTEGPEFNKLVLLLKEMKREDKELFKYTEWNRLGYASFWIIPKNIVGLHTVHIWRDQAVVMETKTEKPKYAVGVTPIYDMLVVQAEKKDQKKFFVNYRKFKEEERLKGK